jgi:hypothetical protein
MKMTVEIDVSPKELREFLGLPDISGLQQDAIEALARRIGSGADALDPLALLKGLVPTGLLSIDEWQRMILKAARTMASDGETTSKGKAKPAAKPRRKKTSSRRG